MRLEYSKDEREQLYRDLVSWTGTKSQLLSGIEKLTTLCTDLCKYVNEDYNPDILPDIASKTADAHIVIEQIILYLKLDSEFSKYLQFKLDRLLMTVGDTSYLYLKGDE